MCPFDLMNHHREEYSKLPWFSTTPNPMRELSHKLMGCKFRGIKGNNCTNCVYKESYEETID